MQYVADFGASDRSTSRRHCAGQGPRTCAAKRGHGVQGHALCNRCALHAARSAAIMVRRQGRVRLRRPEPAGAGLSRARQHGDERGLPAHQRLDAGPRRRAQAAGAAVVPRRRVRGRLRVQPALRRDATWRGAATWWSCTINHRLNVFGFCDLSAAYSGDEFAQSGNVGYLDLVASMKWVRENIAAFGGDPGNVMIYGQSGGGRKVSRLLRRQGGPGPVPQGRRAVGFAPLVQTPEQRQRPDRGPAEGARRSHQGRRARPADVAEETALRPSSAR